jgi:hypothetical protein
MDTLAAWAQGLARTLLADALPAAGLTSRESPPGRAATLGRRRRAARSRRWAARHRLLPDLATTGLHGLDGARYLRDVEHAEPMLCRLVAHHSCAVIVAEERGLAAVLHREFDLPPQSLADALTCCDMTTSPDGEPVHVGRRLAEIRDRYGEGHLVSRSIRQATPDDPPGGRPGERQTRRTSWRTATVTRFAIAPDVTQGKPGCQHACPVGVSPVLSLPPGCSPRRPSRRMAVLQLMARTVAAGRDATREIRSCGNGFPAWTHSEVCAHDTLIC